MKISLNGIITQLMIAMNQFHGIENNGYVRIQQDIVQKIYSSDWPVLHRMALQHVEIFPPVFHCDFLV